MDDKTFEKFKFNIEEISNELKKYSEKRNLWLVKKSKIQFLELFEYIDKIILLCGGDKVDEALEKILIIISNSNLYLFSVIDHKNFHILDVRFLIKARVTFNRLLEFLAQEKIKNTASVELLEKVIWGTESTIKKISTFQDELILLEDREDRDYMVKTRWISYLALIASIVSMFI